MRTRVLMAGLALAAVVLIGSAAPVVAADKPPTKFPDHVTQECFHIIENGGTLDDCHKAPSPILPPTNELVWGAISFAAVFILLRKLAWPGLKKGMESRSARIANDLKEAEMAKEEANQILDEYRAKLADAKAESAHIIEEARQTADAMRRELETRAASDISEMKAKAAADIEAAKVRAIDELRQEVAEIAIGAAELVIERNLDPETNKALVDQYIAQVGAAS
ncbi:MAG: synthase, subunit b [Actinomycetia bacterium]|nr:synthase, subunit b [Actinomycetes bacterium]